MGARTRRATPTGRCLRRVQRPLGVDGITRRSSRGVRLRVWGLRRIVPRKRRLSRLQVLPDLLVQLPRGLACTLEQAPRAFFFELMLGRILNHASDRLNHRRARQSWNMFKTYRRLTKFCASVLLAKSRSALGQLGGWPRVSRLSGADEPGP
jgi:hypothetical protein